MDLSNDIVIHQKKNGVEFLQFRKLLEYKDVIKHAYTIGLDVNFNTYTPQKSQLDNESYNKVIGNYKSICSAMDSDYTNVIKPVQTHTKNVKTVEYKVNNGIPDLFDENYFEIDGLITNKKNIILSTSNADCIILLFFDPVKKVISNVHSGWKGTLQEISIEAVNKMHNEYGCEMQDIICCICPSIRKCHFEVEKDVYEMFWDKFKGLESVKDIFEQKSENKWNIDTVLINKTILKNAGLKESNIFDCGLCSVCNSNIMHSFRVEKEKYGVETALIELI